MVSGPTDYSCRVPRRERKLTIMDELLHNHQFRKLVNDCVSVRDSMREGGTWFIKVRMC